jgi:hypothetical protein
LLFFEKYLVTVLVGFLQSLLAFLSQLLHPALLLLVQRHPLFLFFKKGNEVLVFSRAGLYLLGKRALLVSGLSHLGLELVGSLLRLPQGDRNLSELARQKIKLLLLLGRDLFKTGLGVIELLLSDSSNGLGLVKVGPE